MRLRLILLTTVCFAVYGDGPTDNIPEKVRPIPPPGIAVSEEVREKLSGKLAELEGAINAVKEGRGQGGTNLLADVLIFRNAIYYALKYDEFLDTNQPAAAEKLLEIGLQRANELREGKAPWNLATGLVVRGYRSKIDHSVQPYGLVVPSSFAADPMRARRLDIWFHGRDEKLNEIKFLSDRLRSPGEFVAEDTFVLHLYGRYCNANKFAGEIDLFEALEDVKRRYAIDENRILVRGFSMGGAACWQFAVHYPSYWAAAAPGAGFSETPDFLKVFQNEPVSPPWWEQKLWQMYNCTDYALNLFNCPTVAYSGEIDKQKQAADMMAKALAKEGIELTHIIGPNTPHRYEPGAKAEINRRIDSIAKFGRNAVPREVKFTTPTLRYNECFWFRVEGLEEHWEPGRAEGAIKDGRTIELTTKNIAAFSLSFAPGECPLGVRDRPEILVDGRKLTGPAVMSDRSWRVRVLKDGGKWKVVDELPSGLRKTPGLQGPIDDAFMDSFVFVLPSGKSANANFAKWVANEQQHAIDHWRKQFRGEARTVKDSEITDEIIRESNLVLWGDAECNEVIRKIARELPLKFAQGKFKLGGQEFESDKHAPVLIYPNPLNAKRYVVLNSGFTFREYDHLNNARQISKLPDYAVLDITVPPNSRYAGKVVQAGFFDEQWQFKKGQARK